MLLTAREQVIGETLSRLFYSEMVTPPSHRRAGTREDFHRLLCGMISNRMTRWEDAVALPHLLCKRTGDTDILDCLLAHSVDEIAGFIAQPRALHRYPARIATSLCASARQIRDDWDGSVENMWRDCPLAETLVARLKSLHGVGDKIGNLTVRCLLLDFANVDCWGGLSSLKPSPDRHVLRVFYRLGLIASEQDITGLYEASERLRPMASVECDGAWALGMSNCIAGAGTAGTPLCERNPDGQPCLLRRVCPSRR